MTRRDMFMCAARDLAVMLRDGFGLDASRSVTLIADALEADDIFPTHDDKVALTIGNSEHLEGRFPRTHALVTELL